MIRPINSSDYQDWLGLWNQYLVFYNQDLSPEQEQLTQLTFSRLLEPASDLHALVSEVEGALIGLAHWTTRSSTWATGKYLYLEDLFVEPDLRGKGYGRELIESVAAVGRSSGAEKLYWQTHRDNLVAQKVYETLAAKSEFVIYEMEL